MSMFRHDFKAAMACKRNVKEIETPSVKHCLYLGFIPTYHFPILFLQFQYVLREMGVGWMRKRGMDS